MHDSPGTAVYAIFAAGLAGIGNKLAEGGVDLASVSAFVGSLAALLMAAAHVLKAVQDAIQKYRDGKPLPPPPPPAPPLSPVDGGGT